MGAKVNLQLRWSTAELPAVRPSMANAYQISNLHLVSDGHLFGLHNPLICAVNLSCVQSVGCWRGSCTQKRGIWAAEEARISGEHTTNDIGFQSKCWMATADAIRNHCSSSSLLHCLLSSSTSSQPHRLTLDDTVWAQSPDKKNS